MSGQRHHRKTLLQTCPTIHCRHPGKQKGGHMKCSQSFKTRTKNVDWKFDFILCVKLHSFEEELNNLSDNSIHAISHPQQPDRTPLLLLGFKKCASHRILAQYQAFCHIKFFWDAFLESQFLFQGLKVLGSQKRYQSHCPPKLCLNHWSL